MTAGYRPDYWDAVRTGERDEDVEPYCRECGSEDLAYCEQYANGCEYKCRVCGAVQMDKEAP